MITSESPGRPPFLGRVLWGAVVFRPLKGTWWVWCQDIQGDTPRACPQLSAQGLVWGRPGGRESCGAKLSDCHVHSGVPLVPQGSMAELARGDHGEERSCRRVGPKLPAAAGAMTIGAKSREEGSSAPPAIQSCHGLPWTEPN